MITAETLRKFAPNAKDVQAQADALEAARGASTVTTARRLSYFMGQVYVETGGFTVMVENLNYRNPERLGKLFSAVRGLQDARDLIGRGPEVIANRVYANRLGNGDEASGDGWRYRGSGYKQLTGLDNYRKIGKIVGMPLEEHPELARDYVSGAKVAFAYWDACNCSALADQGDVAGVTRAVNGAAMLKAAERSEATTRAMRVWGSAAAIDDRVAFDYPASKGTRDEEVHPDGSFELTVQASVNASGTWEERTGDLTFVFRELRRSPDRVELVDDARRLKVRLEKSRFRVSQLGNDHWNDRAGIWRSY